MKLSAKEHPELAKRHLAKVQAAWDDPTDWADLAIYGFLLFRAVCDGRGDQKRPERKEATPR
jgi:hypothetical protein